MVQSFTTGLTRAWNWLRDSSGASRTIAWAVSYWPMLAAAIVGLPLIFLPAMFDLAGWVYVFTLPFGVVGGLLAYIGAYMSLDRRG